MRFVRPGTGRESVAFSRFVAGGHSYVIPSDAMRLVAAGRLDRRLFDITALLEFGYDDARRDTVPLIVTHPAGQVAPRISDAAMSQELPSINGTAVAVDKADAGDAWDALTGAGTMAAGVSAVWLDGQQQATLDRSAAQIGAPTAWDAGYTGEGVTVAVLDTGVDQTHPDLADREVDEENFTDSPDNVDRRGHGTHVASIVAGTGAKSGGRYRGIAPGASVMDGKVLNDSGFGQDSWIIAGMEWAAEQGADVVNMSLGGADTTAIDPTEQALSALTERYGTLFVVSAGNAGPIGTPGSAPEALTVGAVDHTDALSDYSSRGPTPRDGVIKPDITAPGVDIVAAMSSAGSSGPPVADGYTAKSGTSMASPHVAGAAALLTQQRPDLTATELKAVLSGSARHNPAYDAFEQGAGRVDVARALAQTVVSEPASLHLGTVAWPHDDDTPVSRTLTYRNLGEDPVTVDLAVAGEVFSLSANQITVPSRGEATVTVTGDTALGTRDGHYSGTVIATSDESVVRTPVVVTREVESYELTLNYTDEHGAPTADYLTTLIDLDNGKWVFPYDEDGSATVRLPKSRYFADHVVYTEEGSHTNWIQQPGLLLDRDLTVTVDAATTRPINVAPPVEASLEYADVGVQFETGPGTGSMITSMSVLDLSTISTARIGEEPPGLETNGWVNTGWLGADEALYRLVWFFDEFPTGFTRMVSRHELATVRSTIGRGAVTDGSAELEWLPQPLSGPAYALVPTVEFPRLPGTRKEYLTTDGVRWAPSVSLLASDAGPVAFLRSARAHDYRPGRTYHERFNHPVFGPATPPAEFPWMWRDANGIYVDLPMFSDADDNASYSSTESANTRLYLGDELVGETPLCASGYFTDLPAGPRTYRLTTEATRSELFDMTTAVSAEWTFTSSQMDESGIMPIELNVVRFLPTLDANGRAPAGRPFLLPLQVRDETGATVRPRKLTVEVSYDEGSAWRRAPVSPDLVARLDHPAGASSVSLRVSATDQDGNTVTQTVIRAYLLR
ncbi:S8 family peptidase [Actinophytocola sediminis]